MSPHESAIALAVQQLIRNVMTAEATSGPDRVKAADQVANDIGRIAIGYLTDINRQAAALERIAESLEAIDARLIVAKAMQP